MLTGLKNVLIAKTNERYKQLLQTRKLKKSVCPTGKLIQLEIGRRARNGGIHPLPKPSNWTVAACGKWLRDHSNLVSDDDVEFLTETLDDFFEKKLQKVGPIESPTSQPLRIDLKLMRLWHCIVDDSIREFFFSRDNSLTREELDKALHERIDTYYVKSANLFNNQDNIYYSQIFTDTGDELSTQYALPPPPANEFMTPDDVKTNLTTVRAKINIVSNRFL